MRRRTVVKILIYLCVFSVLGFYSDSTLTLQILKVLFITFLAAVGCYCFYIGLSYLKLILDNNNYLLYLLSKKKYSKAHNIIQKKYDKVDINTRKKYDYYKIIIEYKGNINNSNIESTNILKMIEKNLIDPNLSSEHRTDYYFIEAENYLELYKKTNEYTNINSFETILNNIYEMIEMIKTNNSYHDYNYYEVSISILFLKAYNITNDITYLKNTLSHVTRLNNDIKEMDNNKKNYYGFNIELLFTYTYTYIYKYSGEQSDYDSVLLHINNVEKILQNKQLKKKAKKAGYISLSIIYEWVIDKIPDEKIQKKHNNLLSVVKLKSKDRKKLSSIKELPIITYPILSNILLFSQKEINKIFKLLLVFVIIVFICSSIVFVGPHININNSSNVRTEGNILYNQIPLHNEPEVFLQNLHNNLLKSGLHIPDDLFSEERIYFRTYLDKEEHIMLYCVYYSKKIISIGIIIKNMEEVDWNDKILPYLTAVIQADNTMLDKDDATSLIEEWYNKMSDIPLIEYKNNRKYVIYCKDSFFIGIEFN